jgi:hypothetical protein
MNELARDKPDSLPWCLSGLWKCTIRSESCLHFPNVCNDQALTIGAIEENKDHPRRLGSHIFPHLNSHIWRANRLYEYN